MCMERLQGKRVADGCRTRSTQRVDLAAAGDGGIAAQPAARQTRRGAWPRESCRRVRTKRSPDMPDAGDHHRGRHILLGVCTRSAAHTAAELVRRLRDAGAAVQVAMTQGAQHFVGTATFQAVSGLPVRTSLWDAAAEAAMGHIELARWADRILVAPATADTLAKLAHGFA